MVVEKGNNDEHTDTLIYVRADILLAFRARALCPCGTYVKNNA